MWFQLMARISHQARKSEEKFPTEAVSALRGLEEELAESQKEKAENKTVHEYSHSPDEEKPLARSPPSATESGTIDFSPVSKQMEKVAREALAEILPLLSKILENVGKTSKSLPYRGAPSARFPFPCSVSPCGGLLSFSATITGDVPPRKLLLGGMTIRSAFPTTSDILSKVPSRRL